VTTPITVTAPVRICDCGGWTDTWFARHGAVLHIAILPGVTVTASAAPGAETVMARLRNYDETYEFATGELPGRHAIIEAAVAEYPLRGSSVVLEIESDMPPGASTGTSAALAVALIAALTSLRGESMTPSLLAQAAHRLETEQLGQQAGVQDQIAAAYGGVNFIEIAEYPDVVVTPLELAEHVKRRLERQLALVYLGRAHLSSEVHHTVIADLGRAGGPRQALEDLRGAALYARDALTAGDLAAFGLALQRNVDAQRRLHPSLVNDVAGRVGALAEEIGSLGWKVNGAGGDGGSIAILFDSDVERSRVEMSARLARLVPSARLVPMRLADRGAAAGLV
jgi:D-glycero-alpha-D-manno-heptose-7-phosphate kinase